MTGRRRHKIHLIRNTFLLASHRDWDALKRGIKPIYTAVNATAWAALDDVPAQTNPFCMPELAAARAGVAAPNGGYLRTGANQRLLRTVI